MTSSLSRPRCARLARFPRVGLSTNPVCQASVQVYGFERMVLNVEQAEFEWVFRSSFPSVLATVSVILHDRARAEEITQDAFLHLFERVRGDNWIEHPDAWVRKVAVRAAIRSAQRERVVSVLLRVDEARIEDSLPNVDLARAVAGLSPRQRAAVALYYFEDRPVDEVARLMDTSASTVKQHLHRARARLAEVLAETREEVARDVL